MSYHCEGESRTWTVGNGLVQRTIEFSARQGIRTTSLINLETGSGLASAGSQEFVLDVNRTRLTGSSDALRLVDSSVGSAGDTKISLDWQGLTIKLAYTAYEGSFVIGRGIKLTNRTTDRDFEIDGLFASEHLALDVDGDTRVMWMNGMTDPMNPNVFSYLDYALEEHPLEHRVFTNQTPRDMSLLKQWNGKLPASNHSNFSYFPWVVLLNPHRGEGLYFGLEWSGPWRIELTPSRESCLATASMGERFRHTIRPGESLEGISLFEGLFNGGFEGAGISTQLHTEKHLTASSSSGPRLEPYSLPYVCWNSWWAFETGIDEQKMRAQAEEAARLGVEAFVVDYGWSLSAMDKRENLKLFPSGLAALSRYVKSLGMKFGLWVCITGFDPELAPTSDPYEWFVRNEDGSVYDEENIAHTCACLASGYGGFLRDQLDRLITDYEVDWLKYDQNMFFNCYSKGHQHQNELDAPYYQVRALYEILDYLLDKHPHLFIENALSGALILDYGIMRRSHTAWLIDDHRSYFVRRVFHGASHPLPPRMCTVCSAHPSTSWDPSMADLNSMTDTERRRRLFDYVYRGSMMGSFNLSEDLVALPADGRAALAEAIELYKTKRRAIKGPIRHILPQPFDPRDWDAAEVYDEETGEGMVFVFRPSSPVAEINLRLTSLDRKARYEVRSVDGGVAAMQASGRALMESGLPVRIEHTTASDILFITRLKS